MGTKSFYLSQGSQRAQSFLSSPFAMNREATRFMEIIRPDCVDFSRNQAKERNALLCEPCGLERPKGVGER